MGKVFPGGWGRSARDDPTRRSRSATGFRPVPLQSTLSELPKRPMTEGSRPGRRTRRWRGRKVPIRGGGGQD